MSKEILKIGVDLGTEKDEQCAVINLHYNGIDHIIYETHDKEQVGVLNRIMCHLEAIDNSNPSEALEILDDFKNGLINKEIGMVMFQQYWFFNQIEKVKQALLKAQEQNEVIVELCEYYGLDNLYPYDDLDTIEHYLKNARDMSSQQRLELLGKLNKLEKENAELRQKIQEPKKYLKWEDLEFKLETQEMFVLLNGSYYLLEYYNDSEEDFVFIKATHTTVFELLGERSDDKQFFNDLHLERVEE